MELFINPLFLLCLTIVLGLFLGRITLFRFRLGASGTLFAGMGLSWLVHRYLLDFDSKLLSFFPERVASIQVAGLVEKTYFDFLLLLFIAAAGLSAAREVAAILQGRGLKFVILAATITGTGTVTAYLLFRLLPGLDPLSLTGVYTGALTSSPGLGVALEVAGQAFLDETASLSAQASVGLGYAIAYPFSVVTVMTGVSLLPRLFKIDMDYEKAALDVELASTREQIPLSRECAFHVPSFALVCVLGILLGKLALPLGALGKLSLGSNGGILVVALVMGSKGRLGPFNFNFDSRQLEGLKQLALYFFLAYVGLNYGHRVIAALAGPNLLLAIVGMATTACSLLVGFVVGRPLLGINWIILSGAVCGAMTSTPGLGAAIEATGRNEAAGGYGATYPVGLLFKVLMVLLLSKLPL